MNTKNDSQRTPAPAGKKQHALLCARERERWSERLQQARERQHLAEISQLKQQLAELAGERDAALSERRRAAALQRQLDELTAQRDTALEQARKAQALQQQLEELAAGRDNATREEIRRARELQRQLDELAAQRDAAQRKVDALETALAATAAAPAGEAEPRHHTEDGAGGEGQQPAFEWKPVKTRGRSCASYRAATAAGVILTLGVVANVLTYHDAQSTMQSAAVRSGGDSSASFNSLETPRLAGGDTLSAGNSGGTQTPPPQTRKPRTRFAGAGGSRQWGPALFMDVDDSAPVGEFDPVVKRQQRGLLVLGFDIGEADGYSGPRTRKALKEFESLYLSGLERVPEGNALAAIIENYAALARSDAQKFGVDQGVAAAIRLSSVRTGIEFSYLMKLAAVESNFDPASKSGASSATGLYQFTRDTWLRTLKEHGDKYGLAGYTGRIEYVLDRNGYQRPRVRDKTVLKHLMELRKNPRVSAMMAAESVRDNQQRLAHSFGREPSEADLYLTHFFGTDGAISFLKALDRTPDAFAVDMFPAAAQSNQNIFHPKTCNPRTVDEVYALFGEKFNGWEFEVAAN